MSARFTTDRLHVRLYSLLYTHITRFTLKPKSVCSLPYSLMCPLLLFFCLKDLNMDALIKSLHMDSRVLLSTLALHIWFPILSFIVMMLLLSFAQYVNMIFSRQGNWLAWSSRGYSRVMLLNEFYKILSCHYKYANVGEIIQALCPGNVLNSTYLWRFKRKSKVSALLQEE